MMNSLKIHFGISASLVVLSGCNNIQLDHPAAKSGYKLVRFMGNGIFEVPTTWNSDAPANGDTADMKIENANKGIIEVHLVSKREADNYDYSVWLPIVDFSKTKSSVVTIDGSHFRKDNYTCRDNNDNAGVTSLMDTYTGDADNNGMALVFACYAHRPEDLAEMEKVVDGYRAK